jgi:SAM-dependent methyltransferase
MNDLGQLLDAVYESMDGSETLSAYYERHGVRSAGVLTVYDDEKADALARYLAPRIEGRIVVEIGGGIGLLAFHMAQYAKRVFCIEADPNWSSAFVAALLVSKPKNVSYMFGAADEFAGQIRGDVALFCTHSGVASMTEAAKLFAPSVLDVYSELTSPQLAHLRTLIG